MSKTKLLVSLNKYSIDGVVNIDTVKGIDWGTIECLIFNSAKDSIEDVVLELSKLRGVVSKIIYIANDMHPVLYTIFNGLEADIYDNEEYLQDSSVLFYLIDNYKQTGMTVKDLKETKENLDKYKSLLGSSSVKELKEFVSNQYKMRTLLDLLTKAEIDLSKNIELTKELVGVLKGISTKIDNIQKESEKMIEEIEKRERSNVTFFFPTYSVKDLGKKVLYIKCYTFCPFLNSFIIAYQHYLRMEKQRISKILFVYPKLKLFMDRYTGTFARLDSDCIEMTNIQAHDRFVTFEPISRVLDAFFKQQEVDVFIVIDYLFSGDDLLSGYSVEKINAVFGRNAMEKKFKSDSKRIISAMMGLDENTIVIPRILNYANANEAKKRTIYYESCKSQYEQINEILGIK